MNKQIIVHIANDYSGSTVYKNLIGELSCLNIEQIVYTPVKTALNIGKNKVELQTPDSQIIYSNILNKSVDRIFYRLKIKKILNDIEAKINFSRVKLIHAHTWYSDGGVAYLLSKKYNIPYIVTVRNTDLNVFQKYLVHERMFGKKIITNAKKVILIAASYKTRLLDLPSLQPIKKDLEKKIQLIPNGVDPYWIEHIRRKDTIKDPDSIFNILFIGKFTKGKNITALQRALILIQKEARFKVKLHIVGGDGKEMQKVLQQTEAYPDLFKYYGKIYDKERLLQIFRSCDIFAMPSRHETFGLVYVESMLQGLPVLYSHNEGIDGFYEENIGEKVLGFSPKEIKQKLEALVMNFNHYVIPTEKIMRTHDWALIAKMYQDIYNG